MTTPLGRLIRRRREQLGLTQEALADALGVQRNLVREWESGDRSVSLERTSGLAAVLDVYHHDVLALHAAPPRTHSMKLCGFAPLTPMKCAIDEVLSLGRHMEEVLDAVRERLGAGGYDDFTHAFLREAKHELILAFHVLLDDARQKWLTPLERECLLPIMGEDRRTYEGHLLRLALEWTRGGETLTFFPQVPILVPVHDRRYRVDYLVMHERVGQEPQAVGVELEGGAHDFQKVKDAVRATDLRIPLVRYDNSVVMENGFRDRLFDAIRGKADDARLDNDEFQDFLRRRREKRNARNQERRARRRDRSA